MSFIEFRDVKKIYKMGEVEIPALAGVDFTIEKGEFVVIAGASGAGKMHYIKFAWRYGHLHKRRYFR